MRTEGSFTAVLLDGMGTLVRLVPPVPALAAGLGVDQEVAERAFAAEVAYYLEHQLEGSGPQELEDLRRRCAAVVAEVAGTDEGRAYDALMGSLRFEAYEDAGPALGELRAMGLRVVVVSNWDASLPQVLADVGLAPVLDGIVVSAVVGAAKPDPRIFQAALARAGCDADGALHVGDSAEHDLRGAGAAGIRAVLLDRSGSVRGSIASLAELPALLS
jgi:HAD superfamily hydrolase (TIGR01549 family)